MRERQDPGSIDLSGQVLGYKRNPDGTVTMRVGQNPDKTGRTRKRFDVTYIPGGETISVEPVRPVKRIRTP